MPARIQLRRAAGWRKPANAIVVSRPSKWGNPFRIVRDSSRDCWLVNDSGGEVAVFATSDEARDYAVQRYRESLTPNQIERARTELRGHDLACWCPLFDEQNRRVPCHADVLLEIANGEVH